MTKAAAIKKAANVQAVPIARLVKTVPAASIAMPAAPVEFVPNQSNLKLPPSKPPRYLQANARLPLKREAAVPVPAARAVIAGSMEDR
jgi:hypothetical protein